MYSKYFWHVLHVVSRTGNQWTMSFKKISFPPMEQNLLASGSVIISITDTALGDR
jgi:hypothetical protein